MSEETRPPQKFSIGQIVALKHGKQTPFRIIGVTWDGGWFYQWNRKNFAAESLVRELTTLEKGGR